jgi:uncharacterized protein (DUF433 family)
MEAAMPLIQFPLKRDNRAVTTETEATGFYLRPDAARIARVPAQRLDAWRREGIVRPTLRFVDESGKQLTGYSFAELNYLRVIRMLRDERNVPLEDAVRAMEHIVDRCGPPSPAWADYRIILAGRHVLVLGRDEWRTTVATMYGQKLMEELLGPQFEELRERTDALLVPTRYSKTVQINPRVASGMPIIRGTRIETRVIYRLSQSASPSAILRDYPVLKMEQIRGALQWEKFLDLEAA